MITAQHIWLEVDGEIGRFMELMKFADKKKQEQLWRELRLKTNQKYFTVAEIIEFLNILNYPTLNEVQMRAMIVTKLEKLKPSYKTGKLEEGK